jgi:nucleoside-diphosphate-sugar epimerase
VFFTAWARQATEKENIRVNGAMVAHLLDALGPSGGVSHAALVTGLKHYLGPFEAYATGAVPVTPFREEQGRQPVDNFYYEQEDRLFDAARRYGFGWSVHRPHTIIGYAVGNAMNMGVTLAVYASLCKQAGEPFVFPGSATQWNSLTDMTDARLLARHLEWAATSANARNEDFNVVNGDVFRWAGTGCGRESRNTSASKLRRSTARCVRLNTGCRMRGSNGPRSRHGSIWSKRISAGWRHGGTRTPTLAVRWRCSPI